MVVAPSLADGKSLKLGKNGATEMIFTPHGTPASEKISLTNTAGTAADAISISSVAGGITLSSASLKFITLNYANLPKEDPESSGALWVDEDTGQLRVSEG